MTRRIFFVADDYGLSPGVSEAILALIRAGRLSGTSCMTGFSEWEADAERLRVAVDAVGVGLHLTLTDQPALTGVSGLCPQGILPPLKALLLAQVSGRLDAAQVHAELDAQHARFLAGIAREPDFIDGHQHVHFLPVARDWLMARYGRAPETQRPLLRGSPRRLLASAKVAAVVMLASGFDETMGVCGFQLVGPLAGFYDWSKPALFAEVLDKAVQRLPDGALFMCHPGSVDDTLRQRDRMLDARAVEFALLGSERFGQWLAASDASVGRLRR